MQIISGKGYSSDTAGSRFRISDYGRRIWCGYRKFSQENGQQCLAAALILFSETIFSWEELQCIDHELSALYNAVKFFRSSIEGTSLRLRTDHNLLLFAFKQKADKVSPRQLRQLSFLSQYATQIEYVSVSENYIADAFSRIDVLRFPTLIDFHKRSRAQINDEVIHKLVRNSDMSLKIPKCAFGPGHLAIYCHILTEDIRPFVP